LPYRPALHIEFQLGKGKLFHKVKFHGFTSSASAKPTEAASAAKAGEKSAFFALHSHLELV
jgi:hypothetical protein